MSANPPAPAADGLSVALVSLFGPWGALAALAYKFGFPVVAGIIKNAAEGKDPTPANWAELEAKIETPGEVLIPKRPA
jgi:hypothetical protein